MQVECGEQYVEWILRLLLSYVLPWDMMEVRLVTWHVQLIAKGWYNLSSLVSRVTKCVTHVQLQLITAALNLEMMDVHLHTDSTALDMRRTSISAGKNLSHVIQRFVVLESDVIMV